jgi:uncharacterized membrane protein
MTPVERHCATECREELMDKINGCALKSGVWKFLGVMVTIVIFVAGVAISIHAAGNERILERQKAAEQQIVTNTIAIAKIQQGLESLEKGQIKLEGRLESFGAEIIKEVRKLR